MYTIKALLLAFLAGVILAGGVTYVVVAPKAPQGTQACAPAPSITPQVNEYAAPAPTTGGLNPDDLKTTVQPNLPETTRNEPTSPPPSSSNGRGH